MSLEANVEVSLGSLELRVELAAEPGRVLAILGPNGAGKTTLLRVLAGLQPLDGGRVALDREVFDQPAAGRFLPPERRPVGYVFQDHLLFPHLSALENVAFGLRARRRPRPAETALGWLERVGLAEMAGSRPARLSGGQSQRVALARALATEPRLLLLDEPLAALDASAKVEVRRELRRHLAAFEGVRLLVTHDPLEAAALADEVLVLEAGRVAQRGTLAEISARPRSRYVADLAGVNVWRGAAHDGLVELPAARLAAPSPLSGEVFALVQPRAVSLYRERPHGSPRNVFTGRAASLESLGDRVRVRVEGPLPVVAEVTPAAVAELGLTGGEEVWVSFKASEVEVYEA